MNKLLTGVALAALTLALHTASFAEGSQGEKESKGGMGHMGGGHCCSEKTTTGWSMMSAEERKAHQEKMHGFKDENSCMAYMEEHHKQMQARAKEQGKKLSEVPHGCDRFKKKS